MKLMVLFIFVVLCFSVDDDKELKKLEDDLKAKKIIISTKKPLFPAISTDGPCKVNLNIGGAAFRMH